MSGSQFIIVERIPLSTVSIQFMATVLDFQAAHACVESDRAVTPLSHHSNHRTPDHSVARRAVLGWNPSAVGPVFAGGTLYSMNELRSTQTLLKCFLFLSRLAGTVPPS